MKPLQLLMAFLFIACIKNVQAQTPNWKWARSAVGNEYDQSSAVTTDANGNIIVAGYLASDSIIIGGITLYNTGVGFDDVFIAKYDSSGNVLWAKQAGGAMDDKAFAVTTDAAGNVYLTGNFYSPMLIIGMDTLINAGAVGDIFIVKYDNIGNIQWAKREGGPGLEIPYAIHVDGAGNMVLTGRFSSNTITFGTTTLNQAGSMDVFVVKYNAAGNVLWAKGAGGGSNDEAYAVDVDAAGNIYVAGYFNQNAMFGSIPLVTSGIADVFLAKFDSAGTVLWAKKAAGNGDDRATALAVDAAGNSYVAGYFTNDSLSFGSTYLLNAPGENSFIAKYDAAGNTVWARGMGADSKVRGLALAGGYIYTCGIYYDDTLTYGPSALYRDGTVDFYLLKTDTAGVAKWAINQTSGGGSNEFANAVTTDAWGNVCIAGYFDSDPIAFGPSVLSNTGNGFDMFVARLGATPTGVAILQSENELTVFPNPANGQFVLRSNEAITQIEIYSMTGEKVYIYSPVNVQERYDVTVSSLPVGIYLVSLTAAEKLYTRKLIIE